MRECSSQYQRQILFLMIIYSLVSVVSVSSFVFERSPSRIKRYHRIVLQLDINDSIEELQSLHKERRLVNRPSVKEEGTSSPPTSKGTSSRKAVVSTTKEKKSIPNTKKQQPKPTIRSIVQMPVGKLTTTNLNSLCNSIRHHRKGSPSTHTVV